MKVTIGKTDTGELMCLVVKEQPPRQGVYGSTRKSKTDAKKWLRTAIEQAAHGVQTPS